MGVKTPALLNARDSGLTFYVLYEFQRQVDILKESFFDFCLLPMVTKATHFPTLRGIIEENLCELS